MFRETLAQSPPPPPPYVCHMIQKVVPERGLLLLNMGVVTCCLPIGLHFFGTKIIIIGKLQWVEF